MDHKTKITENDLALLVKYHHALICQVPYPKAFVLLTG